MPPIRRRTISKASWSQDQLKAALAGVKSDRKLREVDRQFDIQYLIFDCYCKAAVETESEQWSENGKENLFLLNNTNECCATTSSKFQTCFMG
jgi:hypothetical protein